MDINSVILLISSVLNVITVIVILSAMFKVRKTIDKDKKIIRNMVQNIKESEEQSLKAFITDMLNQYSPEDLYYKLDAIATAPMQTENARKTIHKLQQSLLKYI